MKSFFPLKIFHNLHWALGKKQWWARYFPKVPRYRYRYLLEKSTVGTGTIFKKYRGTGTGTRYRYFLKTQLNCNRNVGERLLLEILIFCEKEHDKLRSRATIYFEKNQHFKMIVTYSGGFRGGGDGGGCIPPPPA